MKKILRIISLLCAGLLFWFGYSWYNNDHNPSSKLTLYGNVDIRSVTLGFRVPGRIAALHFEEGDRVAKGTLLAELDKKPYEETLNLRNAQLAEAQAILTNAEKLYNRRSKLLASGAVSQGAYDDALASKNESEARCQTASASLALAQIQLEDTSLFAPDEGIILTRVREPGSIVGEGMTVYTLALDNPVWIRTYVDEPNLGNVHEGQKALVFTDSGDTYQGQVGFISPQAEFTPKNVQTTQLRTDLVYRLRVIIASPDHRLRQGMPVTVTLQPD